jgi:hypothetical protein
MRAAIRTKTVILLHSHKVRPPGNQAYGILPSVGKETTYRSTHSARQYWCGSCHTAVTDTRQSAGLYVEHDATVCTCVGKCFPWDTRQPNWHWRLARLPEHPGDRYWAASRCISPAQSLFFSFYNLSSPHTSYHLAANKITTQPGRNYRTLFSTRSQINSQPVRPTPTQKIPYYESRKTGLVCLVVYSFQ